MDIFFFKSYADFDPLFLFYHNLYYRSYDHTLKGLIGFNDLRQVGHHRQTYYQEKSIYHEESTGSQGSGSKVKFQFRIFSPPFQFHHFIFLQPWPFIKIKRRITIEEHHPLKIIIFSHEPRSKVTAMVVYNANYIISFVMYYDQF